MLLRTFALAALLVTLPAAADMGGSSDGSSSSGDDGGDALEAVREDIEAGRYEAAIDRLDALKAERPEDPDVFNLLGYSYRMLKDYWPAERHYERALELEPEHRGANEYVGQLYLETGRPRQAKERLQVLRDACPSGCEEYDELKAAIEESGLGGGSY